ncbi:hypothetical protein DFQ04_0723 [Algoriphagus boseongensis]|uniref:PepSY domain-containing protein n=1 Tax=Algoriphagus boseongensis TaxID=1442587 RepID=A0A4R6TAD3_9BACT|nr:hypothetical protein [Algoriphagus boseongensis]TDQ18912.1 hypothetical protein DFQ04_0723 [Algoriphagus boseongensis]
MKTSIKLFTLILFTFLMACSSTDAEDPLDVFREIAYNSLTATEKSSLIGDWKEAEVGSWVDGYYLVSFATKDDSTLGPIRVVVDPVRGVVIEKLPRF